MAKRDYYEILGVSKSASADEFKRAYRKLAMQHHPDKHGGDDTKFKELSEAYEVLKDPQKKAAYDQYGHAAGAGQAGGPFGGAGGFGGQAGGFDFNGAGGGFNDIFDMFFQGQGSAASQRPQRGQDLEVSTTLDFNESIFGTERHAKVQMEDRCDRCDGDGAEPGTKKKTCDTCKGEGQISSVQQTILGAIRQARVCPACDGRGQIPEMECVKCHAKGTVRVEKELNIKIPAGIDNGATIRLSGQGGGHRKGSNGDIYVRVRVRPHPRLRRSGQTIELDTKVDMVTATLGGEVPVETVDGDVTLKIPAGTQSGKRFKLSERGVPGLQGRKRGDQLVTVAVETPTKLSGKQKELLEEFAKADGSKKRFWQR